MCRGYFNRQNIFRRKLTMNLRVKMVLSYDLKIINPFGYRIVETINWPYPEAGLITPPEMSSREFFFFF